MNTGTIAELDELERVVRPELIGLGRYLGLGPKRILEIATISRSRLRFSFVRLPLPVVYRRLKGSDP